MNNYIEETKGTITHTMLQAFMECPYYYYHQFITGNIEKEESDALIFGSAFDDFITHGEDKWNEKYAVVARRDGKSGKIELTGEQGRLIQACKKEFDRQPLYSYTPEKSGNLKSDRIIVDYKGYKLSYKPDQYDKEKALLSDIKTAASLDRLNKFMPKYKMQLTMGQFLIQMRDDILVEATLQVVTKETPSRSKFFKATKESLLDNRRLLLEKIDEMILAIESGILVSCNDRENCPAYGFDPCAIQKEYIYI